MKDEINKRKINNLLTQGNRLIGLLHIVLIIAAVYLVTLIGDKLQIMPFISKLLQILTPLFIGLVFAWLFNPLVTWMQKHKIKRIFGSLIVFVTFVGILILLIVEIVPVIVEQVQTVNLGKITNDTLKWIDDFTIEGIDLTSTKTAIIKKVTDIASEFDATSIVSWITKTVSNIISGLGTFWLGLMVGFFLLLDFNETPERIKVIIPTKFRKEVWDLLSRINYILNKFIRGTIYSSLIIFGCTLIGLLILKVPAAIILAIFCAVTNVIPYLGPYIGAIPAVVLGFTVSPLTGILVIVVLSIIQTIEGNVLSPIIMGKSVKLSPVTILVGLLLFGYFFGMIGMIIATPIVAVLKEIITYYNEKYKFFKADKMEVKV